MGGTSQHFRKFLVYASRLKDFLAFSYHLARASFCNPEKYFMKCTL